MFWMFLKTGSVHRDSAETPAMLNLSAHGAPKLDVRCSPHLSIIKLPTFRASRSLAFQKLPKHWPGWTSFGITRRLTRPLAVGR